MVLPIKDLICHYLKQDVLKSEVWCKEGHAGVTTFVDALVFLAQYFDFSLDEDKLLDMTLVPEASIALIEQHRSELNGNIQFCNHLIEEIKRNKQKIIDQPKSLREVKLLLASA